MNTDKITKTMFKESHEDQRKSADDPIYSLQSNLVQKTPLLQISHLKLDACMEILSSLATFLIEKESQLFSNTDAFSNESQWKAIIRHGFQIIIESLDMQLNQFDAEISRSCLKSLLDEILPAFTTNEYRQIILDVLPHFVPSMETNDMHHNMSHKSDKQTKEQTSSIDEISTSIISCFQSILLSDSNALIPIIGCLSNLPLSRHGQEETHQVTLSSLPVVSEEDLPIVVKTMLQNSMTSLEFAKEAVEALRVECLALQLEMEEETKDWSEFREYHDHLSARNKKTNGGGVLFFLGYIVAEALIHEEEKETMHFEPGTNTDSTRGEFVGEGIMEILEQKLLDQEYYSETKSKSSSDAKCDDWTIVDLVALLVLFQTEKFKSRVEQLLHHLMFHPCGFPFHIFHCLIKMLREYSRHTRSSYQKHEMTFEENVFDPNIDGEDLHCVLNERILRSLFEMILWLLLTPCHAVISIPIQLTSYTNAINDDVIQKILDGASELAAHLCVAHSSIQEEMVECLLSMSSLSFLQFRQHLSSPLSQLKLTTHPSKVNKNVIIQRKENQLNGIRQAALISSEIILKIAKHRPKIIFPFHSTILDRIKMESLVDIPTASLSLQKDHFENIVLHSSSILMICPEIIHRFCEIIILFMDSCREDNHTEDYKDSFEKQGGYLDPSLILILVQKLLIGQSNHLSTLNSFSSFHETGISNFQQVSFSQQQAIGIILAMHLITSTPKLKLNDIEMYSLLTNVAKLMARHPKQSDSLKTAFYHKNSTPFHHNHHPLVGIYGCHFFQTIATSTSLSDRNFDQASHLKSVFKYVKNIVSSSHLVKLLTQIGGERLTKTKSVLTYEKSFSWICGLSIEQQKYNQPKREMVICMQDFLEAGGWWMSSWWHPSHKCSSFNFTNQPRPDNTCYNLRQCQSVYIYRLVDIYLELGRKQSSSWEPDAWLLARFQLPKWPKSIFKVLHFFRHNFSDKLDSDMSEEKRKKYRPDDEEEYEFNSDEENNIYPYELWSLDTNVVTNLRKSSPPFALDPSSTDSLLKMGWSCALSMSVCAAVLNHAYWNMKTPRDNEIHENIEYRQYLHQYQLSKFYDLKIRVDMCIELLQNHLQSTKIKALESQEAQKTMMKNQKYMDKTDIIDELRTKQRGIVKDSKKRKDITKKEKNNNDFFSTEYVRALNFEVRFLIQCSSRQYESLLKSNVLWSVLTNLYNENHVWNYVKMEISNEPQKVTKPFNLSLLHELNLQLNLVEHLSYMIGFKKTQEKSITMRKSGIHLDVSNETRVDSDIGEDPMEFHLQKASVKVVEIDKNGSSSVMFDSSGPIDYYGLSHVVTMTGVFSPWLRCLRKKEYKLQAQADDKSYHIPLSKATCILASHYKLLLVALQYMKDITFLVDKDPTKLKDGGTPSSIQSAHSSSFIKFINVCADYIRKTECAPDTLRDGERKSNGMTIPLSLQFENVFNFFEKQLIEHCEDASLATQLLDILFLLTSGLNKIQSTRTISWRVLETLYAINPDLCPYRHHEREIWRSRIPRPPKAFSSFIRTQLNQNHAHPVATSVLGTLKNIAQSTIKTYEQSSVLRHMLLTCWCLTSWRDNFVQMKKLLKALNELLRTMSEQRDKKRIKSKNQSSIMSIPGLTTSSYPVFFEIFVHILIASITLSVPVQSSFESNIESKSPYKNLQDLARLFSETIDVFVRKCKIFPKRSLKLLLRACMTITKVIEYKVDSSFLWRSKQPILSDDQKIKGFADPGSIAYLQVLMDDMVSCVASIINFCSLIRKEAQKQIEDVSNTHGEYNKDKEFSSEDIRGEHWAFAANAKTITQLDLRCEKLVENLRATCRNYNLIPPNLFSKTKLKENTDRDDMSKISDSSVKKLLRNKPKKRIALVSFSPLKEPAYEPTDKSTFDCDEILGRNHGTPNDEVDGLENNDSYEDVSFPFHRKDQASDDDDSSSDSFGAIGDWGD